MLEDCVPVWAVLRSRSETVLPDYTGGHTCLLAAAVEQALPTLHSAPTVTSVVGRSPAVSEPFTLSALETQSDVYCVLEVKVCETW